jgi:hypothetical protein
MHKWMLFSYVFVGMLLSALRSYAGSLSACVGATLSANQHVLVINDLTFDDPDETHIRKVTGSTFHIVQQVNEPNSGLRMSGPDHYWPQWRLGSLWSVPFSSYQSPGFVACPYVLVTDDAEFLILLENGPSRTALRIYRRREHPGQLRIDKGPDHGVLVRAISVDEIRPAPSSVLGRTWTDHTPQWYSGGDWIFSKDNRTLLFRMEKNSLQIDLATGLRTDRASGLAYDPTIPEAREKIRAKLRELTTWGYQMVKHDFSTYDLLGQWASRWARSPRCLAGRCTIAPGRTRR